MYKRSSEHRLDKPAFRKLKREVLAMQVQQTCTDLAEKFEQLHHQVIKPVEKATGAVQSTVDTVQESVQTAKTFIDNVGEQVSKRPWLMMAGGLVAGIGTGLLTTSPDTTAAPARATEQTFQTWMPSEPSFLSKQFGKMKDIAVGAGLALVRDIVKDRVPQWADAADQLTNDVAAQLGAVPFTSPILQPSTTAV